MVEVIVLPGRSFTVGFASRKAAGSALALMWLLLEMSPEQNQVGSGNGIRQRQAGHCCPRSRLPAGLAALQELRVS